VAPEERRVLFSNAAARRLIRDFVPAGWSFGNVLGPDECYCTDASGTRIPDDELPHARAARGEVVDGMEVDYHTPSGVIRLLFFAERLPSTEAFPSAVVVCLFDGSLIRRVEEALFDELVDREEFISLVGHELRTPIAALKLHVQSLLKQCPGVAGLGAVNRATERMAGLVERLVDTARIREVGVRRPPEDLDLCAVVDDVIRQYRSEAARVGSSLVRLGVASTRGHWDRKRLEHVIGLLIANALQPGTGRPGTVACRDLGERASMAVSNQSSLADPTRPAWTFHPFGHALSG
jgi:signal transduction histidine kinase